MAEQILILRDAVLAKLIAKGKTTATARYVPYSKPDQIKAGKWIVAIQNEEVTQSRNVDTKSIYTLDLVYQRSLPDPTQSQPDPLENNAFIDACINEAGTVKALFREGGELRGVPIGGCVAMGMPNQPLYQPDHLINHLIFSSVVRVEFRFEQE
jgi:hypothetical protein